MTEQREDETVWIKVETNLGPKIINMAHVIMVEPVDDKHTTFHLINNKALSVEHSIEWVAKALGQ